MIAYGIGVLPLIRELREAHPRVTQPWYVDDAAVGGTFAEVQAHFQDLQVWVPAQGYYPELTKSILVVTPGNVARDEDHFRGMGIRVVTGHRYLGGFLGDGSSEKEWLGTKVEGWTESIATLAGVALKHPQSAYAGPQKSLQQEWAFVQRVTPGVGAAFAPVEEALREVFLSALFRGLTEGLPTSENTRLPVKHAGLAIPDPVLMAPEKCTASCVITGHLVLALRGQTTFWTADHMACLREGRLAVRYRGMQRAEAALTAALEGAPVQQARRMQ